MSLKVIQMDGNPSVVHTVVDGSGIGLIKMIDRRVNSFEVVEGILKFMKRSGHNTKEALEVPADIQDTARDSP